MSCALLTALHHRAVWLHPNDRARHERTRTRTKERAMLELQALVDAFDSPQPPAASRMRYAFNCEYPYRVSLRRELGEQLVSMGLIGGAMAVFEELELWDNLIACYRLLQKKPQAEQLIRTRLDATPDEPRLWCALGDLNLDDDAYRKAWDCSGRRSARAQRSLAASAMRRNDYPAAAVHYQLALAISPLHPDAWFALGYCRMKAGSADTALQAFTRAAQLEPDNGEAWNNIAAIHLQARRFAPALSALTEAVKYRRDSWQTWSNYAAAAVQAGAPIQALRGAQQVFELTGGQRAEAEVLAALVTELRRRRQAQPADMPAAVGHRDGPAAADHPVASASAAHVETEPSAAGEAAIATGHGNAVETQQLQQQGDGGAPAQPAGTRDAEWLQRGLGVALKAATASPAADSSLWGALGDYYTVTGYPGSAREAQLKRVRSLQGSAWQTDAVRFEALAEATLALGAATLDSVRAGSASQRDLVSVRMQLGSLIGPAEQRFQDIPVLTELQHMRQQLTSSELES